jgi:hypothetical protein
MPENTTANAPVKAIGPGGTKPTQTKTATQSAARSIQKVKSADRNTTPAKR